MSFQTYNFDRVERRDASGSMSRATPKSKSKSILKKFKSFVCLRSSDDSPCEDEETTSATLRRRTEALRAAGLLPQSKIYGQQPYRDAGHEQATHEKQATYVVADEKDLISFENVSDAANRGTAVSYPTRSESEWNSSRKDICDVTQFSSTPTPPISPTSPPQPQTRSLALATSLESRPVELERPVLAIDTSFTGSRPTLPPADFQSASFSPKSIRMRRMGSLKKETEAIEDEESRRLTEIAFLS